MATLDLFRLGVGSFPSAGGLPVAYLGLLAPSLGRSKTLSVYLLGPFYPIWVNRMTDENNNATGD